MRRLPESWGLCIPWSYAHKHNKHDKPVPGLPVSVVSWHSHSVMKRSIFSVVEGRPAVHAMPMRA